jgi:hypothetical protein
MKTNQLAVTSEPNLWQEIKDADIYHHSEYRSRLGLVAWWPKDGAWHAAINGKWTAAQFPNPESAMIAVERGEIEGIVEVRLRLMCRRPAWKTNA